MTWKVFWQTLAATAISGAVTGAGQAAEDSGGKISWQGVAIGAAIGAIGFLLKSPVKPPEIKLPEIPGVEPPAKG